MNLNDIVERVLPPRPWDEGDNIPWDEPGFSERMLAEHLAQEHDLASRRFEVIDRQVAWIHDEVLGGSPTKILELTCGPGLYTNRLAMLGHECAGIDFGPAAIRHARETASTEGLSCTYRLEDVRTAEFGDGWGLVMMNNGQLNVFRRDEANRILRRAHDALAPGGWIVLEPQRFETVAEIGKSGSSWYSCGVGGGLFSARAHLCLQESFWDGDAQATTQRFYIVDAETGATTRHALTTEAYTDEQLHEALAGAGFREIRLFASLVGDDVGGEGQEPNRVVVARR